MSFGTSARAATPLQAARLELGWKQTQTVRAMLRAAEEEGITIATERSLKTMLSRWENGHGKLDAVDQRLLCKVYGQSPEQLGLASSRNPVVALSSSPAVGPEMVRYFRNVLAEHLRADNLMGPHHLVDVVCAQTALLDRMLPKAGSAIRGELVSLAFRYHELAGWLYQDAGSLDSAMRYTDRALEFAMALSNGNEVTYALMRKADIAADLGEADRAISLTEAALRDPVQVSPTMTALVLRLRGRAHAQNGNASECARALDGAFRAVMRTGREPDGLTDYCTPGYIGMEAASAWSTLGRFDTAVTTFERSLPNWPAALRRDQGLCLARLTNAHAGRGDLDRACETGQQAVESSPRPCRTAP